MARVDLQFILIAFSLVFLSSCEQKPKVSQFPNQQSEMALAMRDMVDKLKEAKSAIENGETPQLSIEDFKGKHFTDSSFEKPGFDPMADGLLVLAKDFDENPNVENYEKVVNSCKACHQMMCPGPLEMIKTLELE